jgi:hypothetical protein
MGVLSSKSLSVSDPSKFATKLDEHRPELVEAYKEYVYVIVGAGGLPFVARLFLTKQTLSRAGACGAVLASRLSEDPEVTVLLVEAGTKCAGLQAAPCAVLMLFQS